MANGDISTIIDSLEYSTANYSNQTAAANLAHIAGDIYVTSLNSGYIAPSDYHGLIFTLDIDSAGNTIYVDGWQFGTDDCKGYSPNGIMVPGTNYYLMVRSDENWDVQATTTTISNAGTITESFISEVKLAEYGTAPNICRLKTVGSEEYFVVFSPGDVDAVVDDGFIVLISVNTSTGNITKHDGKKITTDSTQTPQVRRIADGVVALYYGEPGGDTAELETWAISENTIGSQIDSQRVASNCNTSSWNIHTRFCKLVNDLYVCAWTDYSGDGNISTISIDGSGNISDAVIDTFEFNTSTGLMTDIQRVRDDVVAIAYLGSGEVIVETYEIASNGTINETRLDVSEALGAYQQVSYFCRLTFIEGSGNKWAITKSRRSSLTGGAYVYTVSIEGTDIYTTESTTIQSNAHIWATETSTIQSNASVYYIGTDTIQSNSHIYKTETDAIQSNSSVYYTETITTQSNASVYYIDTDTIQSDSHIWNTHTQDFNSASTIYHINSQDFYSDVYIWRTEGLFNSDAYIITMYGPVDVTDEYYGYDAKITDEYCKYDVEITDEYYGYDVEITDEYYGYDVKITEEKYG